METDYGNLKCKSHIKSSFFITYDQTRYLSIQTNLYTL